MQHKFVKVEVFASVRGRPITNSISAPLGISQERYEEIDRNAVRAFGNEGTRTVGTFVDGSNLTLLG